MRKMTCLLTSLALMAALGLACGDDTSNPPTPDQGVADQAVYDDSTPWPDLGQQDTTPQPDQATGDMALDSVADDMATGDTSTGDTSTSDTSTGDTSTSDGPLPGDGGSAVNVCAKAKALTITGTLGTVSGEVLKTETQNWINYPANSCTKSTTYGTPGSEHIYKVSLTAGKKYQLKVEPSMGTGATYDYNVAFYAFSSCATPLTSCLGGADAQYSGTAEEFQITAATTGDVYIAVDSRYKPGTDWSYGKYKLTVLEVVPPTNEKCANAKALTFTGTKATASGDTTFASDEFSTLACKREGETTTTTMAGPQVYYKLTAAKDQWYKVTLDPGFTGYAYLFTAAACSAAAIQTDCQSIGKTGNFSSSISSGSPEAIYFKAPAAGAVYVAVDSTSASNKGSFTLTVEKITKPTNITCATAKAMPFTAGKAGAKGDIGTGLTPDEFSGLLCGSSTYMHNGPQAYWKFNATAGKGYKISLTADTISEVYFYYFTSTTCTEAAISTDCKSSGSTGDGTGATSVAQGDTTSLVYSAAKSGVVKIGVDTKLEYPAHGGFSIDVEEVSLAPNNTCATAQKLTFNSSGTATATGDTTSGTVLVSSAVNLSSTSCTGYSSPGNDLFYSATLTAGKTYTITMKPDTSFDPMLFVFTDCTKPESTCQATWGSDNIGSGLAETVTVTPTTTGTFYIGVDSYDATEFGTFTLEVK
jgi:hypothetical protein